VNYDTFLRLVRGGEKTTVDFKIECGAFQTGNPLKTKANAELLKDICAMANNGNIASYILIGVSDNGKGFRSVSNNQLTSDAIQRLVHEYLRPVPWVRVHNCAWRKAQSRLRGKHFVVIQIGPSPRTAYHFDRDFIDWGARICLRRNEVWIRNDTTTDVATPEQVLRLLKEKADTPAGEIENNTEYSKAPKNQQQSLLRQELIELLDEIGIRTFKIKHSEMEPGTISYPNDLRALLKIRGRPFVFRLAVRPGFSTQVPHSVQAAMCWHFEHGILFLPLDNPSKNVFKNVFFGATVTVHYKEPWGFFTIYHAKGKPFLDSSTPNKKETYVPVSTLINLRNTERLRNSFMQFLEFAESNDIAFNQLNSGRKCTNRLLKYWQRARPQDFNDYWDRSKAAKLAKQAREVSSILMRDSGRL
jgi:Schlafen, AlbA_2